MKVSDIKCLVTGAAGFIGSNLADALLEQGASVRGLDNFATGRAANIEPFKGKKRFEFVEADIRDAAAVSTAARGIDVVFHQAALPSVPRSIAQPRESFDVNVTGTFNVLMAAKDNGARRVVFASSSSIYGNVAKLPVGESSAPCPISPYGATKVSGEALGMAFAASFGISFIALRYFNVFGPRQNPESEYAAVVPKFITSLLNGGHPVIYGDGTQTRDFTYVGNVVAANILAATRDSSESGAFNIAAGSPHSVKELLENLCAILGKPFNPEYQPARPGDIRQSFADVSRARQTLGFEVKTDFKAGLELAVSPYRKRG